MDRIEYGYDRASNRLWRQNVTVSGEDELYGYDGLYQLLNLQRGTLNGTKSAITGTPNWEEEFSLDPSGNWNNYTTLTSGSTTLNQSRAQNTSNEITALSGSSSLVGYDAIGNMHSTPVPGNWSSAYTLKWDAWNRLVQVKSGSTVVATYGYDALNRRVTQVTALGSFDYYYSKDWQILQENSSGTLLNQFVWGLRGVDDVILRDATSGSSTQRLYALRDVMHVTAITNTSGSVLERYDYDAFGNTRVNGTSSNVSSYGWEIRFCSYLFDQVSGFYQVRNRYLHPFLGRWLLRDRLKNAELSQGNNLYWYVRNNPVNRIDPLGLLDSADGTRGVAWNPGDRLCSKGEKTRFVQVVTYADGSQHIDDGTTPRTSGWLSWKLGLLQVDPPFYPDYHDGNQFENNPTKKGATFEVCVVCACANNKITKSGPCKCWKQGDNGDLSNQPSFSPSSNWKETSGM